MKPDWTYSKQCGCKVMFIGAADYLTSRTTCCENRTHCGIMATPFRDDLVDEAKKALADYQKWSIKHKN